MKEKLTEEDIKILKYQCRAGIVVSTLFFLLGISILSSLYLTNEINSIVNFILLILSVTGIAFLIAYSMIAEYIVDIKNKEKLLFTKFIQAKELKKDYEAGSGSLGQKMKSFNRFDIIIDNTRYRINKSFFETCNEGDEVIFHTAPKSKFRLYIELKKDRNIKFS